MLNIDEIANQLRLNIKTISSFTAKTYIITDESDTKYILKFTNESEYKVYNYLKHFECDILYPIRQINYKGNYYFLFKFINQTYDNTNNLPRLMNAIKQVHEKTAKIVMLKKNNLQNIYKMRRILNNRFTNLEQIVRQIENNPNKSEKCWIILSKYNIFLHAKNIMIYLEEKIIDKIRANLKVTYAINMGNPCLSHFKEDKIINYYKAYFGLVVSDVARFYVQSDHLDTNIFLLIDSYLSIYEDDFYKIYFKYLVLYIYIINLNIDSINNDIDIMNFLQISQRIKKLLHLFKNY